MTAAARRHVRVAHLMGTVVSVHVYGTSLPPDLDAAIDGCFDELRELERVFSTFRPDSDVSRYRDGAAALGDLDPRVADVRDACRRAELATGGRFTAWFDGRFDPTGYVKGWAVESTARRWLEPLVARPGVIAAAIDAGGDLQLFTAVDADWTWNIGIADPHDRSRVVATVEVRDGAVATSGTAERGSHILDPATGQPAAAVSSATVIMPSLTEADVWATAAVVAGPDLSWIDTAPISSGMIVAEDGSVRRWVGGIEISPASDSVSGAAV